MLVLSRLTVDLAVLSAEYSTFLDTPRFFEGSLATDVCPFASLGSLDSVVSSVARSIVDSLEGSKKERKKERVVPYTYIPLLEPSRESSIGPAHSSHRPVVIWCSWPLSLYCGLTVRSGWYPRPACLFIFLPSGANV
jgi:hypothetical protein